MTLSLSDVWRGVGVRRRTWILRGVTIDVTPGEVVALVGPNGSGKSTALGVLAGELRPDRGAATVEGVALRAMGATALARRRAVVPQHTTLRASFDVETVVAFGRAAWTAKGRPDRDRRIVRAALAAVGLDALRQRRFDTLSGGERQRVMVARALAQVWPVDGESPGYLLLDEATSALDLSHGLSVLSQVRAAAGLGVGVLAVVHDLSLAARFADRVVVMQHGAVAAEGSPRVALDAAVLARVFGVAATPPVTVASPALSPHAPPEAWALPCVWSPLVPPTPIESVS